MQWFKTTLHLQTEGQGLIPITGLVQRQIDVWKVKEGMCFLFIQHSSASLAINESFDPTAKIDMEEFLQRIAPQMQSWYKHTLEGPDDSPSHLKALITPVDLSIPIDDGKLSLGIWQGVYLMEHREYKQNRKILMRCLFIK